MKKQSQTIKVPIYNDTIKVIIQKKIKHNAMAYVNRKDPSKSIKLCIKSDASQEIIAHEAVHICNFIFDRIYSYMESENDEPYAYLLGWVVGQINRVLEEERLK